MPIANVRGANINYEVLGTSGPWVALSPGGRRALDYVKSLARHVADAGYRVLIHDRRNCGVSDIVIGGDQSEYEIWADDLYELLVQLKALPVIVGGSSSGCRLSVLFALKYPRSAHCCCGASPAARSPGRASPRTTTASISGRRRTAAWMRSARSITSRSASRRGRKTARP